jgi:hypothetical protein
MSELAERVLDGMRSAGVEVSDEEVRETHRFFDERDERRALIERNREQLAELEASAFRITTGPAGRCFEMVDGKLFTIRNPQPPDVDDLYYLQVLWPLTREDAEDFYGWTPA